LIDAERCIGCRLCAWACPYGAREYDAAAGVMRKCTLCIDRRDVTVPACVATCPSGARHFGDIADPGSAVSELVRRRGGFALLPEYGPAVRYLPPRPCAAGLPTADGESSGGLDRWIGRVVSR
jgi:Fe-S-cluster-containing dehydrogenase component